MRIVSIIFYVLGVCALGVWGAFYWFAVEMACAMGGPNGGTCDKTWPWRLDPEGFFAMILLPGACVAVIFGVAVMCGRAAKRD